MRLDPIFRLPTPILFAHRGGAKEVAESTAKGFRHALDKRTDVLEVDLQVTAGPPEQEEFVVWHGPGLDNVRLALDAHSPRVRRKITEYRWSELSRQAWVADPGTPFEALHTVPQEPDRLLLTLQDFLTLFPHAPLNLELKSSFKRRHLARLIEILEANNPSRVGVIASNYNEPLIDAFDQQTKGRFATNLPILQSLVCRLAAGFHLLHLRSLNRRAVQLPHPKWITPVTLVDQVRRAGGGTYVFLTAIPLVSALDAKDGSPEEQDLFELLDRGVDGIMTDRPGRVRQLMDQWIAKPPASARSLQ
jgi:glycerophosphoryl diester phosphodiesterase